MKAFLASALVLLIGSFFLWHATDGLQAITAEGARRLHIAREEPPVPYADLETSNGTIVGLKGTQTPATLVNFIYTRCPALCQNDGSNLARLRDRLIAEGLENKIRMLSVSFDPDRDGLDELASYASAHGADGKIWMIARPIKNDLSNILTTFDVLVIPDKQGGYEHNAALHIVNQEGRLVSIVDTDDIEGAVLGIRKVLQ